MYEIKKVVKLIESIEMYKKDDNGIKCNLHNVYIIISNNFIH